MAGLFHDAGKADEYVFDSYKQRYAMSERGQLIDHKQIIWSGSRQLKPSTTSLFPTRITCR